MSDIHPVFHVSQLRRCLKEPEAQHVPVEAISLQKDLQYQEVPVKILDTVTKRTRNSEVRICRVQWSRHGEKEATWEREDALKKEYPYLFTNQPNLEDEIPFKWGRFVTPGNFLQLNHHLNHSLKIFSKSFPSFELNSGHPVPILTNIHLSFPLFPFLSLLSPGLSATASDRLSPRQQSPFFPPSRPALSGRPPRVTDRRNHR